MKNYTFWRTPQGRAAKRGETKHAPLAVLAHHGRAAAINAEGKPSWTGGSFMQSETAIRASVIIIDSDDQELNETDTWSLVSRAIRNVIKKSGGGKPIESEDLLDEADRLASEFLRQPAVEYMLASSISVADLPAKIIRVRGCKVRPITRKDKWPKPEGLERAINHSAVGDLLKSGDGKAVKVLASGRSIYEAADKAIDALNLLRGLWTLFATYGAWSIRLDVSPKGKPVGVIQIGPVHTLHTLDGSPACIGYWFEPQFSHEQKVFAPKDGWSRIEKLRRTSSKQMATYGYKHDLEDAIILYAKALDYQDYDVALLQLWSLLERLTNISDARYEDLIKRATWYFKNRQYKKDILESLRVSRNQYVHAAKSGDERDQLVYSLKSFVEPHLISLIRNDLNVASLAEYGECLSLPRDKGALERIRRHSAHALKLLKKIE